MTTHTNKIIMETDAADNLCMCPSFNCYSSDRLAEMAVRVAAEDGANNGDEEFEFALVRDGKEISAEELGSFAPVFPVFNLDLAFKDDEVSTRRENELLESSVAIPLGKLLIEDREEQERDYPPSCSSSEADELENIPEGTYCVWRPKAAETPSPSRCKKSKSTGSASKRWKFPDFMRRSNSDGKDSFVFLTPKHREARVPDKETESPIKLEKGKGAGGARWSPSAHEALYVQNRAVKEGNRKKSYLPYRRDLVGFFANVNVLGKVSRTSTSLEAGDVP